MSRSIPRLVSNVSFWKWFPAAIVTAALVAAGCEVGPDYKLPKLGLPDAYSEADSAVQPQYHSATNPATQAAMAGSRPATRPAPNVDLVHWWRTFNDPGLNSLVDRAEMNNLDLAAADARIRQARANRTVVAAPILPKIDEDDAFTHIRNSKNITPNEVFPGGFPVEYNIYQLGTDVSWELDLFGGTRRGIESAEASTQAAIEDRRDVLVSLLGEVAVNYVQLRSAQQELAIAQHNLQSQQQTLALTRSKAEGGLIPYLNVTQQEAQVATTAATIPTFETQIRQNIHQLGLLLGQTPGSLSDDLSATGPIPLGPSAVPPGIPSQLLLRRPDVRRAERDLAASNAQIGVATADLFPKISLTGEIGTQSSEFKQILDRASDFYTFGPTLSWNIFDAGATGANIDMTKGRTAELLADYKKAVLTSFTDVDDALVAFNREQLRFQSLREAVDANQKSVDLSTEFFEKGSADFLSVLDAERDLFAAQDAMIRSQEQVSVDLIALYKALGGGWDENEQPATRP